MSKKKILLYISLLILSIGAGMAATGYYLLMTPQFHPQKKVHIYVDRDDTVDSLFLKLKTTALPHHFIGFEWMAQGKKLAEHLHTGCYVVKPGESVYEVYSRFSRGYQTPVNVTLGSTRTLGQMARHLSKQLMIDSVEIASIVTDSAWMAKKGYTPQTIACLFIPNTYEVYWNVSAEKLLERLEKEHKVFWNAERRKKAEELGMTTCEVCTLASIVEEETNNAAEKPIVAGLYINRLKRGIPLQADPTVKFAWQDFGLRRISNKHLEIDSPYNTYRYAGLPPGPIRIASTQGINSVLNYTHHSYLYMCAKEDFSGTHNFAVTYGEHCRNAQRYWNALNRRRIFK